MSQEPKCENARTASQAAVAWLNEKDVVRLLLRAHLHQRQYMDQARPPLCTSCRAAK